VIGGISIMIGFLGIMDVSVSSRTREALGVRKHTSEGMALSPLERLSRYATKMKSSRSLLSQATLLGPDPPASLWPSQRQPPYGSSSMALLRRGGSHRCDGLIPKVYSNLYPLL
jgi:hypothetical protein